MIKKNGRVYWLDFWIGKKRIRRSLKTDEKQLALERAKEIASRMRKEAYLGGSIGLRKFADDYLNLF